MTSGDPNIALRGKLTEILSNVPIETCRILFTVSFYPYRFLSYKGVVTSAPPTTAKLAHTATGVRVK